MQQLSESELAKLKEIIASDQSAARFISTPWGIIDKLNIPENLKAN